MSGTGPQLAPNRPGDVINGRNRFAHLLHALNQPLTGLQCSMELALAAPRSTDQYVQTLNEALELISRVRVLTDAVRELSDLQSSAPPERLIVLLDNLLRETARELQPVAESRNVLLTVEISVPLRVRADVGTLTTLLFRALDCAISLSAEGSRLGIEATCRRGEAVIIMSWQQGSLPAHSPFSRPELGLLIAQAAWERLGGTCEQSQVDDGRRWTLRIPIAWNLARPEPEHRFVNGGGQQ
jgi:C4-dicarboxylate-specific signal transduction histidine kinase